MRPFIPADVARQSPDQIERWAETYILKLLDLAAELGVKVIPMFWGVAYGWEAATGYPWGFFAGGKDDLAYDLIAEGRERFVTKTERIRDHANEIGISLAHEIHPGPAASCADDFLALVEICANDPCLGVNADPSHCWAGEGWHDRFTKVGEYVTGCHVKDHIIRPGMPLLSLQPNWKKRGMQFTKLGKGQIDLAAYTQLMEVIGYARRYCEEQGTETAPLVGEAESAFYTLDVTSTHASRYIANELCLEFADRSFEEGMGEG
jgi:sugar phosphate isomerase/epimerase